MARSTRKCPNSKTGEDRSSPVGQLTISAYLLRVSLFAGVFDSSGLR